MILKDKVVVITGSTRGIGLAVAEACASEGAYVVVSSRKPEAVEQTCRAFKESGFRVSGIAADVSSPADVERLLNHAVETWGRVDVWINNAGLSSGFRPLDELTTQEISDVINVNLTGLMYGCRIVVPYFIKQGGGVVLNMSGKGGRGEASPNLAAYSATKAAITNLTASLAQENKSYPISIHTVIPGMVDTDFYRDVPTSTRLAGQARNIPLALNAFGVPAAEVGRLCARLAAQTPGEKTGKCYTFLKGTRLLRGIALMTWYGMTGKLGR